MYASRGCIPEMVHLIMRGCNINCGDGEGLTCLHHACEYNRLDVVEALLDVGKSSLAVNAQDKYGWTPLHCAAHHGSVQCVQKLLTCNVNLRLKSKAGKTCLHLACAQNRNAIVPLLLQKDADLINLGDDMGMTPLHEAAYRGHMALYQELCKHPKADIPAKDKLDRQPGDYVANE
ncbi:ankyrin repeat domain-containing protein [archaeon]|nr:MAG: ankyrin repeat domain-containing protein [archaeon]